MILSFSIELERGKDVLEDDSFTATEANGIKWVNVLHLLPCNNNNSSLFLSSRAVYYYYSSTTVIG